MEPELVTIDINIFYSGIVLPCGFRVQEAVKLLSAPPAPSPMGGWCQASKCPEWFVYLRNIYIKSQL